MRTGMGEIPHEVSTLIPRLSYYSDLKYNKNTMRNNKKNISDAIITLDIECDIHKY